MAWVRPALPLAASVMLVSMVAQFRVPLLPDIGRDLAMSASQLGLVATVFAMVAWLWICRWADWLIASIHLSCWRSPRRRWD